VVTWIVSPSLAPTWNVTVMLPLSRLMLLNTALEPMRSTSEASMLISDWIALRSSVESVPFLYCTASSRTRWSIECTSCSEPSAVCTSDTASCALRWACARPAI
jgi:hypothetical protein